MGRVWWVRWRRCLYFSNNAGSKTDVLGGTSPYVLHDPYFRGEVCVSCLPSLFVLAPQGNFYGTLYHAKSIIKFTFCSWLISCTWTQVNINGHMGGGLTIPRLLLAVESQARLCRTSVFSLHYDRKSPETTLNHDVDEYAAQFGPVRVVFRQPGLHPKEHGTSGSV